MTWQRSASPTARACAWATSAARSRLPAEAFDGVKRGVVIVESIAPNDQFEGGWGINTLTSAVQAAPYGGAPFHDNHVWIRAA